MKASLVAHVKERFNDDTVLEIWIWKVPEDKWRLHGYKYRLHYGRTDGTCIVRFDNEALKGDHKHVGKEETPYKFISLRQLIDDFIMDVELYGKGRIEVYEEDKT